MKTRHILRAVRRALVPVVVGGAAVLVTFSASSAVTLTYSDASTNSVSIKEGSGVYLPYRPIDDWQQTAMPRPWTSASQSTCNMLASMISTRGLRA